MGASGPWSCREHGAGAWPKHASWNPPLKRAGGGAGRSPVLYGGGPEERNDGGDCQSFDACLCVAPLLYSGACSVFDCKKSCAIPPAANADAHQTSITNLDLEVNYYCYTPKRQQSLFGLHRGDGLGATKLLMSGLPKVIRGQLRLQNIAWCCNVKNKHSIQSSCNMLPVDNKQQQQQQPHMFCLLAGLTAVAAGSFWASAHQAQECRIPAVGAGLMRLSMYIRSFISLVPVLLR